MVTEPVWTNQEAKQSFDQIAGRLEVLRERYVEMLRDAADDSGKSRIQQEWWAEARPLINLAVELHMHGVRAGVRV